MSTHCVSMIKNFNLSLKIKEEEEAISMEKQGIVSILDNNDSTSSSNGEEDHHEKMIKDQPIKTFDIWGSILSSSKNEDSSNKLTPTSPYVHPLVKRSTSSLSEKSLEICTESLGSETGSGSDCFPSSPTSECEDSNEDKDNHHHHNHYKQQQYSVVSESSEDVRVYNYSKRLLSSFRSFPPSLPSVHIQSRRQNGRLILETASVSPKNGLHAQRLDGHLLLTFINRNDTKLEMENLDDVVEEFEQVEGNETPHLGSGARDEEEFEEEEEKDEDKGTMMEQSPRISSEMTNVNRTALMILEKNNQPIWSKCTVSFSMTSGYFDLIRRFNNSVNAMIEEEKETSNVRERYTYPSSASQSLPPPQDMAKVILAPTPPPTTVATSLNGCEYFWRKKPTVGNLVNSSTINKYYYNNKQFGVAITTNGTDTKAKSTTKIAACTQDLVLIRGNKASMNNNLVPLLRSYKEPWRSLIIWEPYCIATS